jgi:hypothetical protein
MTSNGWLERFFRMRTLAWVRVKIITLSGVDYMSNRESKVAAYLSRIGFAGTPDGSAEDLAKLQECHLHTVPYENLDIYNRVPLSLDT